MIARFALRPSSARSIGVRVTAPSFDHRSRVTALALGALLSFGVASGTGCASIANSGPRELPFDSLPSGASVEIVDAKGNTIDEGTTPFTAKLSPKSRYFRGARYRLRVSAEGYETHEVNIVPRLSGWYLGNVVFGGPLGLLVIDPVTGAMWNLEPDEVEEALDERAAGVVRNGEKFLVVLSSELSATEREATAPIGTTYAE